MCVCVCVSDAPPPPSLQLWLPLTSYSSTAAHHSTPHHTIPYNVMSVYPIRYLSFKSHTGISKRARDIDWIGGVSIQGRTDGHVADRRYEHALQYNRWYAALGRVELMQLTSPFPLISFSSFLFLFPHISPLPSIPFHLIPLLSSAVPHHTEYRVWSGYWDWANKTNLRIVWIYHNWNTSNPWIDWKKLK